MRARPKNLLPKWDGATKQPLKRDEVCAIPPAQTSRSNPLPPEYAPVIVSENEHSEPEGNDEDEASEVDIGDVMELMHAWHAVTYNNSPYRCGNAFV